MANLKPILVKLSPPKTNLNKLIGGAYNPISPNAKNCYPIFLEKFTFLLFFRKGVVYWTFQALHFESLNVQTSRSEIHYCFARK